MGFGVQNISAQVVQQQQQVADAFYQQKLIPQKIDIQSCNFKTHNKHIAIKQKIRTVSMKALQTFTLFSLGLFSLRLHRL